MGEAYILSEALPMPEIDVTMKLTVDDDVECSTSGVESGQELARMVTIPGLDNFIQIRNIEQQIIRNDAYKFEQILVLETKGKARIKDVMDNLEVWILPKDKPETPGMKARKNYHWYSHAEVGPEILKKSTRLELTPIEAEHEYSDLNSFKFKADPKKYLYIKINKGTPFYGKYYLSKEYAEVLKIKDYPKQLEIMHEGIILSSSGQKKISIMSQGVKDVQFRIGRVQPDQLNHLVTQSNGNLKNIRFNNYNFDEDNLVENYYETKSLFVGEPGETNYFSFNFSKYLQPKEGGKVRNGIFFFEVREYDRRNKSVRRLGSKRLVMISDLGLLVKDGTDDTHDLFVQSISTGRPVSGAKIQVLGKNGIPVLSKFASADGHISLPSLRSFKREKSPAVYIITKGNDLTFMPVNAPGRWLNYSKFDVGGVHGAANPKKLTAYLFSDRGIYRPGDEFHVGMIVKSGNWDKTIVGTPLEATIRDARGLEIFKKKFKLSSGGFDEISYQTESTSPTGTYQLDLYTIRRGRRNLNIGSVTVQVEEFLPDRLKITSMFTGVKKQAWVSPENLEATVTLRNLFGLPAKGNRVVATMSLSPGYMWFKPYRNFRFNDPLTLEKSFSETLPEQTTDKNGKAVFDLNLRRFDAATYYVHFSANGFEKEGGRNVATASRILVSPLKYLIGTKANGDLSYIYKNSERLLKVIAINPELKKVDVQDVQFELNEIKQISVLTKMPNGTYAYKSVEKKLAVSTETLAIPTAGLDYTLPTQNPGEFELIIKNKEGIQFSKTAFSVVGRGNLTRNLDKTAELEIKLNKTDYAPGEMIEVYVKAPYKGAGLITIERDKIYSYQWFQASSNSFIKKIKLPANLEGNGYVNVSFVRAADSKEIFMSPLSYGIAPFSVSKKKRINKISIDIPAEARSGEPFPIKYKAEKPGKIVIFAVDEGILQVAGYQTPDPLAHFFRKRALEVETSQLLDLILPEFSLYQLMSAMGGGMDFEMMDELAKNLNPFKRKQHKPVAFWSGIIDCDRTERTVKYTVPDYFNGTLRVMAVVVSDDAIDAFEEKSIVKNPYVISPNVPMFAAPGDSFKVSVTVTNIVAGSGKKAPVRFEATATPHLKIKNGKWNLKIDEDSDTTLSFWATANNLPGGAAIKFKASGSSETTKLAAYLSVRPAVPYHTKITTGVLTDNDVKVNTPRQMYKDFRVLNSSVSFLPLGLSKGLVTYLDRFPHGCTEQVVSQAFPYLFLKNVNGFGVTDKQAEQKVKRALKILQSRQNYEGKFGIWAANNFTSDFITVYGAHFLTECKEAGYYVSERLMENTIKALNSIADEKKRNWHDMCVQSYAIYILTRNQVVTTNKIASLRKRLDERDKYWKKMPTAAYLGASYMIMKQEKEGMDLLDKSAKSDFKIEYPMWYYSRFINRTQILYLLSNHYPEMLPKVSDQIISEIGGFLEQGHYNTVTSSHTILALNAYAKAAGQPSAGKVSITEILKDKSENPLILPKGNFPTVDFSEKAQLLHIKSDEDMHLYYQVVQGGFDTTLPQKRISEGIELYREFTDVDGRKISKVKLGEEVQVHIKMRSLKDRPLYNMAIVDLLPAGLEAVPTSVRETGGGSWNPEHTDIREDRLVIYGTVSTDMQEFVYTVRAINKGHFTVPPLYGESMYDRDIYGFSPQDPIVVE